MSEFRGWTRPGPIPPGAHDLPDVPPDETLDFISGHFRIFQLRDGHRFSTDDVLAAWYATTWCPSAGTVLDLGSGIGSLALIAAWRLPGARLVTVEAQEMSVALARKSVAFNGLTDRVDVRCADLRDPAALASRRALRPGDGQPAVLPAWAPASKATTRRRSRAGSSCAATSPTTARSPCGTWRLAASSRASFRSPTDSASGCSRPRAPAGLAIVRHRPVVLREGSPPLLGLYAMTRATDLPEAVRGQTWVEPDLVIRRADGAVHPEYQAIKLAFGFPP